MLEGLEASEVKLSRLEATTRIDAEFYGRELIALDAKLQKANTPTIEGLCRFVAGPFGSEFLVENYIEDGHYRYVRGKDVKPFFIEEGDNVYIPKPDFERLSEYALQEGDILLSVVGTLGNASIVTADNIPAIFSCKSTVLRCHTENPWFLISYLNSTIGQKLLLRRARGAVQTGLNLPDIRALFVPTFSEPLKTAIGDCAKLSDTKIKEGRKYQAQAEQTLLRALGLEGWEPPEPLTYTRRASEALAAARFDAEHFRPKFAALLAKMKEHGQVVRLGDCVRFCERGRQPQYANEGLPVINSRHVRANNVVLDEDNRFATEDPAQLKLDEEDRFTIKQGDLLINGTGVGTMGRCAPYLREDNALPDNHVTILRMKSEAGLDPVFLSVQLNSIVGQMQVEQYFKGSSGQIELYPSEIKEFRIWLAPPKIQQQIKSHLDQAHQARQEAQALLARAKRAVEVAIEESEQKAMHLLAK